MRYPPVNWLDGEIRVIQLHHDDTSPDALHFKFARFNLNDPGLSPQKQRHQPAIDCKTDLAAWRRTWDRPNELNANLDASQRSGYIALSYEWGAPEDVDHVYIDGEKIVARKPLVDALRAIRRKGRTDSIMIWADFLCVDQLDTTERNGHVGMMSRIYAAADEVVVWLGGERSDSDKAVDLMYELDAAHQRNEVGTLLVQHLREPTHAAGSWLALHDLMSRSYWNRLWIIQELCLGKHSTVFLCGDRAIPFHVVYSALWLAIYNCLDTVLALIDQEHMRIRGTRFPEGHKDLLSRSFLYHINLEKTLQSGSVEGLSRRNREKTTDGWHIMPMLDYGRNAACSLDHDRIYGLFALLPQALREGLQPDYALTVNELYVNFAQTWISVMGDLEILSQCCPGGDRDLPSWVPDWRCTQHIRLFTGANVPYKAGDGIETHIRPAIYGRVLMASGFLIDSVDGLGHESTQSTGGCMSGVVHSRFQENAYGTLENLRTSFWRTLVGNITTGGHPAKDGFSVLLAAAGLLDQKTSEDMGDMTPHESVRIKQFLAMTSASAELEIAGYKLPELFSSPSQAPTFWQGEDVRERKANLASAVEQAYRFSRLKRLATTEAGRLAMVPDGTLPGDEICILLGSNVPLAIRRLNGGDGNIGDTFEVIGGCYVHGIMEGVRSTEGRCAVETVKRLRLI